MEPETVVDIAAAVRAREVPPSFFVERSLERLTRWQESTNAFTQLYFGAAREEAARLEERLTRGDEVGPLAGVPFAAKDLFDVEGRETTGCCLAYEGNVATRTAEVVRRLLAADAILVGKTNMHELAAGATNLVSACGRTSNPWDLGRMTGGSSGGSAAALATGIVPLALGTDTGGSIRIPASFCGVAGLKPTHGALPLEGVLPLALSLDCPGPMTMSVTDLSRAWEALAQADADGAVPERVGVLGGYFADRVHPEVRAAVRAAAEALAGVGIEVVDVDGYGIEDAPAVWNDYAWSQFAAVHGHLLANRELLGEPTASFLEHGRDLPNEQRLAARARAEEYGVWFAERLRAVDVLLAPATPFPAPPSTIDTAAVREGESLSVNRGAISVLTRPVNLAGLPALSIPGGFTGDGLPFGLQAIGPRGSEAQLLKTGELLEGADERFRCRAAPWPPPMSSLEDPLGP